MKFGKMLQTLALTSIIAANSYAQISKDCLETKMFKSYELGNVMFMPIAGKKPTYITYKPINDTVNTGDNKIVGRITGSADISTILGDNFNFDITLVTDINEKGQPVRSYSIRRNENRPDTISSKDLELIANENLNGHEEKITSFCYEVFENTDDVRKKVTNMRTGVISIIPKETHTALTAIFSIIHNPQEGTKKYLMQQGGNYAEVYITTEKTKDGSYRAYSENVPKELEFPILSGGFKFNKCELPSKITTYIEVPVIGSIKATAVEKK